MLNLGKSKVVCMVFLFCFSSTALSLDLGVSLAYSKGGDTLVNVSNDNDFLFGDGITFGLVARQKLFKDLELRSSTGLKYKSETYAAQGANPKGDVIFTAIPVTLGLKYNLNRKVAVEFGGIKFLNGLVTNQTDSTNYNVSSNTGFYSEVIISTKTNKHFEFGFRYIAGLEYYIDIQNVTYFAQGDHFIFMARNYF